MERASGIPLTPSYTRDPSPAVVAAANPSAGLSIAATGAAPPSSGLARILFMAPRPTVLNIAQNLFRGEEKKTKKGKIKKGRAFMLPHCYKVFKDVEEWKAHDDQKEGNKRKAAIDLDDEEEASSDDGKSIPTQNSVAYSKPKIPNGSTK
ncbi:Tyrosine N-monooxygenase [Hordeum vulgare]|nr:Tyrosine N-monooxygenase [Hordeum vulgare]